MNDYSGKTTDETIKQGTGQDAAAQSSPVEPQPYKNMSVQDKLNLADQRLESLKGTDKYDAYKQRVDAMHAKYDPMISNMGKDLAAIGYDPSDAKKMTWDYGRNRLSVHSVADSIQRQHDSQVSSAVTGAASGTVAAATASVKSAVDAAKAYNVTLLGESDRAGAIVKGARDALASSVKTAGRRAVADATKAAGGKLAEASLRATANTAQGNALADAITHFGLQGDEAARQGRAAGEAFKAAKTAKAEIDTIKTGINIAGRNARVGALTDGLKTLSNAHQAASDVINNAPKVAIKKGVGTAAKGLLKNNLASGFAVGGITSATKGIMDLGSTLKATGGEGLGTAIKDTFTTKQGLKNLGLGFVGALRDVGNSMSFGLIENGDRTRGKMSDAKGGNTRADAKGGDAGQGSDAPASEPSPATPASGPRIVINPSTFRNKKDALCVAWNERLRIWMEDNDFRPRSEPTQEQREFFSDTPYGNDELQMRRTILARIATLDTSIKNPTDMQLGETAEMLRGFAQTETPSNDYEAKSLARLIELVDHVHRTSSANDGDLDELIGEPDESEETRPYVDDGDLEELVREDLPDDLDAELTDEESDDLNQLTAEEP